MAQRDRVIYASQAVYIDGKQQSRIQSLGANTTFTSEDVFELGQLDRIDVVDDVPKVAVTLNMHEFGDITTISALASTNPGTMVTTGSGTDWRTDGHLTDVSGNRYRGVALADFGSDLLPTIWAPVQEAAGIGDPNDNIIDYTLFMDKVATNRITFTYNTTGVATCNFTADGFDKTWFMNSGKYINEQSFTLSSADITNGYVTMGAPVANMKNGNPAFLYYDVTGAYGVLLNGSAIPVVNGSVAASATFVYHAADNKLFLPTSAVAGNVIDARYAASSYAAGNKYFDDAASQALADGQGGLRQGQVEIALVDGTTQSFTQAWRVQTCTVEATLTREELKELGHLKVYALPVKFPLPMTVRVDSLLSDLSDFATFSGQNFSTIVDLDIYKLLEKANMSLVVMTYEQSDTTAGGTGVNRTWAAAPATRVAGPLHAAINIGDQEVPTSVIIVEKLKPTAENYNINMGANATQAFDFRAINDMYVVDTSDMNSTELATLKSNITTISRVA